MPFVMVFTAHPALEVAKKGGVFLVVRKGGAFPDISRFAPDFDSHTPTPNGDRNERLATLAFVTFK